MAFSAEYTGTSDTAIYKQSGESPMQLISEMSEAFYQFLANFRVDGAFIYR